MEELKDRQSFGKRGEMILVAQLVTIALVVFPPMRLHGIVYLAGGPPCVCVCVCVHFMRGPRLL